MTDANTTDLRAQHRALTEQVGLVSLGHRTRIVLTGADRARFLHNLCTNEIRKLPAGAGCEAFVTTVQGKTLAHVFVLASPESLLLETVPGVGEKLLAHLDHYLVSEKVSFEDQSQQHTLLLAGPAAELLLGSVADIRLAARLAHTTATIADRQVWVARADLAGPTGYLLAMDENAVEAVRAALLSAGAMDCGPPAFESARVEWGFPWFGRDITEHSLPQEVDRDRLAISFVKGCYLGQETVARIDALGHVNKTLVGLRFDRQAVPPDGVELMSQGQPAGMITSAAYSPTLDRAIALAYVRRGSNQPGMRLHSAAGEAEVVALPARGSEA